MDIVFDVDKRNVIQGVDMRLADYYFKAIRHKTKIHSFVAAAADNRQDFGVGERVCRKNYLRSALFFDHFSNIVNTSENFNSRDLLAEPAPARIDKSDDMIPVVYARA